MKYLLAGLLSVVLALIWQRLLLRNHVDELSRVGFLIPIGEEVIKFGAASLCGTPVLPVYLLFGLGEGFYEAFCSDGKPRFTLIVAGFMTHLLFGAFFILPGSSGVGLGLAIVAHLVWNNTIMKLNWNF